MFNVTMRLFMMILHYVSIRNFSSHSSNDCQFYEFGTPQL